MEKYGHHIPHIPCKFAPMKGHELMTSIQSMTTSAGGLDGWELDELKGLPIQLWRLRAKIHNLKEKLGKSPRPQKQLYGVFPPKTDSPMALDTRPLRIHTICHRAYIKTRF